MRPFYLFVLFCLLGLAFAYRYSSRNSRIVTVAAIPTAAIYAILLYTLISPFAYLLANSYREHIEPVVATLSLMVNDGLPVYADLSGADRNQLVYGPSSYLMQAWFLRFFDDPITASKLYGIACLLLGMVALFVAITKRYSTKIATLSLFYFSTIVLLFAQVAFRNQADSIMLLGNSLAAASALLPSSGFTILLLALGSALSINAKFHSAGYILPLIVIIYRQHGGKRLAIAAALTLPLLITPFLHPSFSFHNFTAIMAAFSKHHLLLALLKQNLTTGLIVMTPLIVVLYLEIKRTGVPLKQNDAFKSLLATLLMLLAISIVASKDGAGTYHLLPFAPALAALFAIYQARVAEALPQITATVSRRSRLLLTTSFIGWAGAISLCAISAQRHYLEFIMESRDTKMVTEALAIRNELAGQGLKITMGYSDREGYDYTFIRPLFWPILKNDLLDPAALMDLQLAGIEIPEITLQKFANQDFDLIIVPNHGEPFTMANWYSPNPPLFDAALPRIFAANYHLYQRNRYFNLWQANRLQTNSAVSDN